MVVRYNCLRALSARRARGLLRPLRGSGFALGQPDAFGAGGSRLAHFPSLFGIIESMKQILVSSSGFGYPPAEGRCEAGATRGAAPRVIELYKSLGGGLAYEEN